tara:strand:+ start:2214 stop:4601 length:2388 start_codon:yes stop_codon:yes gene_type:complete
MDLTQQKLTRSEWNGIEIPVSSNEKDILKLIIKGYTDVNISYATCKTLFDILKTEKTPEMEYLLFQTFLEKMIKKDIKTYNINYKIAPCKTNIKKRDQIRVDNFKKNIDKDCYEYLVVRLVHKLLGETRQTKKIKYYYSLHHLLSLSLSSKNSIVEAYATHILKSQSITTEDITALVYGVLPMIEQNPFIYENEERKLYNHQKQLFQLFNSNDNKTNSKLVLYTAPTGTGKTLSPIGLSSGYRVIFVCAARHVGLALAKSAISMEKKIAFAFGCETPEDIRLHYFSVKECVRDRRTGGIRKVDNSKGELVEIMICDIKSYVSAMCYMLAFNDPNDIIMYWDEPTISLDYEDHPLHSIIQTTWNENIIPNIVLSSATLPQVHEIHGLIADYKTKHQNGNVVSITSNDCRRTIPILNKENKIVMPHYMYDTYDELQESVQYCKQKPTMYRYLDINEILKVVRYLNTLSELPKRYILNEYFTKLSEVSVESIKTYYLDLLENLPKDKWEEIKNNWTVTQEILYPNTIHMVTHDAYTLTHGPTIYLTDEIDKITMFCMQSIELPSRVIQELMGSISFNNALLDKIRQMEKDVEDGLKKDENKEKKVIAERVDPLLREKMRELENMRKTLKTIELDPTYVPNTREHYNKWCSIIGHIYKDLHIPKIENKIIERIMLIDGVKDMWKVLLMMGIGVFCKHESQEYVDIMKELAEQQCLFMIIASTDYIYGTNYQFCHAYLGKDLEGATQEKIIQAMGRVGRGAFQHSYSLRFRNNEMLKKLFKEEKDKKEVYHMNRLFVESL